MMRILHIVEAAAGGVLSFLSDLNRGLAEKHDIYILYSVRDNSPAEFEKYFPENVTMIQSISLNQSLNFFHIFKEIHEIKEITDSIKPDIIHMHSSVAGMVGRIAFMHSNYKLFYTPHGYFFQGAKLARRFLVKLAETLLAQTKCVTIACGEDEYKLSKRMSKNAKLINNGLDISYMDDIMNYHLITEHPFRVYTSGRIFEYKNPELFNKIAIACPDIEFVWIGDGIDRKKLTAKNIHITGDLERESAIEAAMNCDVFCLCSISEGLPIALLEAMYLKNICITSDIATLRTVISDKENGFVCKSLNDYVNIIYTLREKKYQNIIASAVDYVKKYHDASAMIQAYEKVYLESLMEKKV